MSTIKEPTLRELAKTKAVCSARIVGQRRGFVVRVNYGDGEHDLVTSKGRVRQFASLGTVASFLSGLGLTRFEVDVSEYVPGRLRKARPDRSIALKRTRSKPRQDSLL